MKIGVVGGGVVGSATARAFLEYADEVRVYDVVPERRTHDLCRVLEGDVVFVCLPTPQREGALACDTSAVEAFFRSVADTRANYVLRSTVPVGFTRRMRKEHGLPNLVHSPEFLSARTALIDAQMPARNVVGRPPPLRPPSGGGTLYVDGAHALCALYRRRWPHVPLFVTDSDTSEAAKLFCNAFSAVKIAAFNELEQFARTAGVDWGLARQVLLAGGWVSPMHTEVPGRDGFGFGGACLPKDLANLIDCMAAAGLGAPVAAAAHGRNLDDRKRSSVGREGVPFRDSV